MTRTCYTCVSRKACHLCGDISTALLKYNASLDGKRTRVGTAEIYTGLARICTSWSADPLAGLVPTESAPMEAEKVEA